MQNAISDKNYKLFIGGSFFSLLGDYIGLAALNWFVWKSSNSVLSLSILNFARLIPALFIGYLGGYLCDKYNPKKILISLYITTLTLNIILFILISLNEFQILFISALVFIKGIFSEMEPAVRNSYLPFLVPPQFIYSAVSLYSTVLNISGVLGPAIAGYALIKLSPNYLYLTQVIGQGIILISILYLPIKYLKIDKNRVELIKYDYKYIFNFLKNKKDLLFIFISGCLSMFFIYPYIPMMSAFASLNNNNGPEIYGNFLMISALGCIIGSSFVSFLNKKIQIHFIFISIVLSSIMLMIIGYSKELIVIALGLFFIGFFSQFARTMNRIYFQIHAPEKIRGRLISISLCDRGFIPLGVLFSGFLSELYSISNVFIFLGLSCFIFLITLMFVFYFFEKRYLINDNK
ncbi:MFS transporter [Silvanigrella paludirubra]|uniref:MFS transporter n=1 Tax=Silvanigrella paludirubra TaxID=2499159 RepID=A0A6N6VY42_9BACT|nr:MFS transporter [Silvanigrella paludirubra]KAB8041094.1 MFS transporter [Silvanigrella paludirubra]